MKQNNLILTFLLDPQDKLNFSQFFDMCYKITKGYLFKLRGSGYPIPLTDSDLNKTLDNLTVTILSDFLSPRGNQPCHIVFDYYRRHNMDLTKETDPESAERHFRILLFGFLKKKLSKTIGIEDPQQEQLKKTLKAIFAKDIYKRVTKNNVDFIYLREYEECLFELLDLLNIDLMELILNAAYYESKTYSDLCRNFFIQLFEYKEYQNMAQYHPLIKAIQNLYRNKIDIYYKQSGYIRSPKNSLIRSYSEAARKSALEFTECNCMTELIEKKRLTLNEKKPIIEALKLLIEDYSFDGNHDLLPKYFRETMPKEAYKDYHKKYRYHFESLVDKLKSKFIEDMKNVPEIRN